jgi:hypothetical protein
MTSTRHAPFLMACMLLAGPLASCDDTTLATAPTPGGTTSTAPTVPTGNAGALVAKWEFDNVVYVDAEGNTESTAWGDMQFNPDGTYVQSLHIGQFLNGEEGTYRITGADTVVLTPKTGEPRTLTWAVSGDRLSLTSTTPTLRALYGLVRGN